MEQVLEDFAKATGKNVEAGIAMIGKSAGRKLADRTQRFGLKHGPKLWSALEKQIWQVYFGVNLGAYPQSNNIKDAHYAARRNGRVPHRKFRKEKGNKWQWHIGKEKTEAYIRLQKKKLGRAKAAWVTAADEAGDGKLTKIPAWISRHLPSPYGGAIVKGEGLKRTVEIYNKVPYLDSKTMKNEELANATAFGMKNGFKRIVKITEKDIEKANRKL